MVTLLTKRTQRVRGREGHTSDRISAVRDHVSEMIQSGRLATGARLPSARQIAADTGVSFVSVVSAIKTLVNDGVLDSEPHCTARVNAGWRLRALPGSLVTFLSQFGGGDELVGLFQKAAGKHRVCSYRGFERGQFEMLSTPIAQMRRREFMDLTPFVRDALEDKASFFTNIFDACRAEGTTFGVPVSFSPKVMIYNPRLLRKAGVDAPAPGWMWSDFLTLLRRLKPAFPEGPILNWGDGLNIWVSLVYRAGGALLVGDRPEDVRIDAPKTRLALRLWKEVGAIVGGNHRIADGAHDEAYDAFMEGRCPLLFGSRMGVARCLQQGFDDWDSAPLPLIPGGCHTVVQGTNILCVRTS